MHAQNIRLGEFLVQKWCNLRRSLKAFVKKLSKLQINGEMILDCVGIGSGLVAFS